jgi:peptidoglycan/xylan/chitin deacetylase (PgdA/CDA1 family)
VVSFCFDDFPSTAYTSGGSILKTFGVRGTYYAALGLMNTTNELGPQMTQEDVESVVEDGHELASHTFSHLSARRVPLNEFERDVMAGRDAVRALTGTDEVDNFAYPYGHVTLASKNKLGEKLCTCRGIYPGINGPDVDLNLLRANSLYGSIDQLQNAQYLLSCNDQRRGWLIFYTHDVQRAPSQFGCTPDLLDSVVELTLKKKMQILTVAEVVKQHVRGWRRSGKGRTAESGR